jgi:hypothetical protein
MEDPMNLVVNCLSMRRGNGWRIPVVTLLIGMSLIPAARAQVRDDGAKALFKTMSDYVAGQKNISIAYDSDIEVITGDLQKIQFTSSGQLQLSRPDKVHATRTGGYTDVEFFFDGKVFTFYGRDTNVFAQSQSAGSFDQLVGRLRAEYSVEAPGADLLVSNVYDKLIEDVVDARHIGLGVIDGIECEHLAFRTLDVDWQVWIEVGARPIPRKYVITSKAVTGGPQYTLRIKDWKADAAIAPDVFTFKQPAGARKVEFKELADVDEVPAGVGK